MDKLTYKDNLADSNLKISINKLIEHITSEKKFRFEKKELSFDTSVLEANGILKNDEGYFEVDNSNVFFYQFYLHYADNFSFSINPDIDNVFAFIESIDEEYKELGYNAGIATFFQKFSSFILLLLHDEFNLNFNEYAINLSKTSGRKLYDFCNYYCGILPYLKTDVKIIHEILNHLMIQVTDDTVRFNGNIGELRRAVINYSKINADKGVLLWDYIQENNFTNDNLNSAIIQGIYEVNRNDFWKKIVAISRIKDYRLAIILSLSSTKAENEIEAEKHLSLINSFIDLTEIELFNLPQFLRNLINTNCSNQELKRLCFVKFEELIVHSNQNLRFVVLSEIAFIQECDNEKTELIKKLIETIDFDKKQINSIAQVFNYNKSLIGFIEVIHLYACKHKLDFNADIFSLALNYFQNDQSENFSIELIKLLTNDLGEIRFIGSRILNHLTPHRGCFLFQTDILKLDALTQYKLWLSVLNDEMKEPNQSLPMLLPLLRSTFSFVKETFICKIEELTEEYGNSVVEVLDSELDLSNQDDKQILDRIKNHANTFWKEISKKTNIKELNPLYTQSNLYTLHSINYGKSFNKSLSENIDKNSAFMPFATTVILAKGGGWKQENNSKIEKLGKVSTSFQLPRSYFISPESYDWNFRKQYMENWKNILKEWEVIISS